MDRIKEALFRTIRRAFGRSTAAKQAGFAVPVEKLFGRCARPPQFSVADILEKMRGHLRSKMAKISGLFRALDSDGNGPVSAPERRALPLQRYVYLDTVKLYR